MVGSFLYYLLSKLLASPVPAALATLWGFIHIPWSISPRFLWCPWWKCYSAITWLSVTFYCYFHAMFPAAWTFVAQPSFHLDWQPGVVSSVTPPSWWGAPLLWKHTCVHLRSDGSHPLSSSTLPPCHSAWNHLFWSPFPLRGPLATTLSFSTGLSPPPL